MAKSKEDIVRDIILNVDEDLMDDEIIHLLLEKTVSRRITGKETLGQRQADTFAKFAGSWKFILGFIGILFAWIILNITMLNNAFDPYPFILLNLLLSCVAAIQAPLIMMSQNRQEEKDRQRAENDYKVNLKTEVIIQDIHEKLEEILINQEKILENRSVSLSKYNKF